MVARDVMATQVISTFEGDSAADLTDVFQQAHVHGAPVVDEDGQLVGMVSLEDILIGSMSGSGRAGADDAPGGEAKDRFPLVGEIMTAPAIAATEDTPVTDLCAMMWRFHIHHVPIVDEGKVTGMVSSLDICRAIGEGKIVP